MGNEHGSAIAEYAVILCLVVVAVIFVIGMFGAMEQTEKQMTGGSDGSRDACIMLCRVRFLDGLTDVCKFTACVTRCNEH